MEKTPDAGKDGGQEEKGVAEDEMVGWHHRLSGHEFKKIREMVKDREAWRAVVRGVAESFMSSCSGDPCTGGPLFVSLPSLVDSWLASAPWPPRVTLL